MEFKNAYIMDTNTRYGGGEQLVYVHPKNPTPKQFEKDCDSDETLESFGYIELKTITYSVEEGLVDQEISNLE